MFEFEEEIMDDKTFSSKIDSNAYVDLESRISNPADMRTILGCLNSGGIQNNDNQKDIHINAIQKQEDSDDKKENMMMIEDDGNDGDGEEEESEKNGNEDEDKDKKKAKNVNINTKGGGPTAFAKDMRTVFNNYLHLEEKDTPLYNSAKEMRTEFNRLYKQYVEEPFLQSNASTDNNIVVNNNKKKDNDKMDVDKNSGSDNDGDSSDEEEDEYDEEWLELRQTSIAAASFHSIN